MKPDNIKCNQLMLLAKITKNNMHEVITKLATSKNVLFPGPKKIGNRTFLEVASMVVTWWIVFWFCPVKELDIMHTWRARWGFYVYLTKVNTGG